MIPQPPFPNDDGGLQPRFRVIFPKTIGAPPSSKQVMWWKHDSNGPLPSVRSRTKIVPPFPSLSTV